MKRRLSPILATAAIAASLLTASSASAAVEFGDNCAANNGVPGYTFVGLTAVGNPLPLTAPVGGVITQWKSNVNLPGPPSSSLSETLQVLRQAGGPQSFTVVAQSASSAISNGPNSFSVRLPVQAGDRLGLTGAFAPLYCQTGNPGDSMGVFVGSVGVGGTATFTPASGYRVPAAALIEPDADNDGFGDETQDKCPQSAAFQIACPLAALEAIALKPGKRFVKVLVSPSIDAPVSVVGTVNLGKGAKATLKAGPKSLTAGTLGRFTLRFPSSLKERLTELGPKQKLTLKITASSTNVAGQVSTDKTKVKLKGQG